jgi:uncharacterized protein YjbI with pentapeptide repeats
MRSANVKGADFTGVELGAVTMNFSNFSQARHVVVPEFKKNLR